MSNFTGTTHVEVVDPSDVFGSPAYDGEVQDAHKYLDPGVYEAVAANDADEESTLGALTVTPFDATFAPARES